jgi:hypothetical protein
MEGEFEHGGGIGEDSGSSTGKRRAFIGSDASGRNSAGRERNADSRQDRGIALTSRSDVGNDGSIGENAGDTGGNANFSSASGRNDQQTGNLDESLGGDVQTEGKRKRGRRRKFETEKEKAEISITDEWSKIPHVPMQDNESESEYPKNSYPKKVKDAKVVIYSNIILGVHKGLSSLLGPEAMIEGSDARSIAEAYVVCEEYYGWKMIEKWAPIMGLLTAIVAVEGPIIKKLAIPEKKPVTVRNIIIPPKLVKS